MRQGSLTFLNDLRSSKSHLRKGTLWSRRREAGVAEEDSPLERCGLRTGGGERIVLGEDNIPTEEEKGTSQDLLGEDRPPSLSARRMSSDQSEQRRSQLLLPPRLPPPALPSPSPSCYLHYHHTRTAPTTFSFLSPRPGQTPRPRSRRTPTVSAHVRCYSPQ